MVNFQDFITVVKEAQNSLNELKEQNKEVEKTVKDQQQSTYQEVYEYFMDIRKMMSNLKLMHMQSFIETPIKYVNRKNEIQTIYFKIDCRDQDEPEIAVFLEKDMFVRWIRLKPKWEDILRDQKNNGHSLDYNNVPYYAIKTLVERWDEYEDSITAAIKDAIINYMANQIEEEKSKMINNQTILKNAMSGIMD